MNSLPTSEYDLFISYAHQGDTALPITRKEELERPDGTPDFTTFMGPLAVMVPLNRLS